MQTRLLKFLTLLVFLFIASFSICRAQVILTTADSLFKAKQYTQSFSLYNKIYESGRYTPAMLLKMAYIQEGLGHVSKSIHYLQLYIKATDDDQAEKKIGELAEKNNLEGYSTIEDFVLTDVLRKYSTSVSGVLLSLTVFFLALLIYQKRKQQKPLWAAFITLFVASILFIHTNLLQQEGEGIVSGNRTYLMSGPSSGADVVAIIDEGHQLKIKGHEDVWLKVLWQDKVAFVKEDKLLKAQL